MAPSLFCQLRVWYETLAMAYSHRQFWSDSIHHTPSKEPGYREDCIDGGVYDGGNVCR